MNTRTETLLAALGIDAASFERVVECVLSEHLVAVFARHLMPKGPTFFQAKDSLRLFRDELCRITRRKWSDPDLKALFDRVRGAIEPNFREPIDYADRLKLLWQVPLECVKCHGRPPDVRLHVDHILPVAKGGRSRRENLQLLCDACNLRKGSSPEVTTPWLNLM